MEEALAPRLPFPRTAGLKPVQGGDGEVGSESVLLLLCGFREQIQRQEEIGEEKVAAERGRNEI